MVGIFHFHDPDIWPAGDVAAVGCLRRLTGQADAGAVASAFAPYRSILARYLWRIKDGAPLPGDESARQAPPPGPGACAGRRNPGDGRPGIGYPSAPPGPVAQWLEPAAHNGLVAGSSPAGPTRLAAGSRTTLAGPPYPAFTRFRRPTRAEPGSVPRPGAAHDGEAECALWHGRDTARHRDVDGAH